MSGERLGAIHIHSAYSHDGRDTIQRLREFALERGLAFLGLTDHAEDFDAAAFASLQAECAACSDARVTILPGLEYRFAGHPGLHLLALGLREWMAPATPAEFLAMARTRAGFTIAAHPVLYNHILPPEVAGGIDAIEVWNASYNTRYLPDPAAIRLLKAVQRQRPGVVGTAGLDQHDARNDRETRVRLLPGAAPDPLEALRQGQFENVGRTMRFGARVPWGGLRLGALVLARWGFDRVERTQERVSRWRAGGRRRV